jgi:hypothetical protein
VVVVKLHNARRRAGQAAQMDGRQADNPDGAASDTELSKSETEGTCTARSSARHAATIINKFCEKKKNAVREIGFEGLLHLPLINKANLKFTLYGSLARLI